MPGVEVVTNKVVVHPLVLLSVVDHFNRMGKIGNQKRVVGVLLGCWKAKGILDVSNSFAVPFDEDDKDKSVWFLDHDYLENMYGMFKKVNAREKVVGWYHTGPKLHQNDVAINDLIRRYCSNSVLVIIDAKPKDLGLPTEAYKAVEEIHDDGSPTTKTFEHVPSEIGAEEAEEVGVEHLLRDIKDTTVGSLSQRITNQFLGLKGLNQQIVDIRDYLTQNNICIFEEGHLYNKFMYGHFASEITQVIHTIRLNSPDFASYQTGFGSFHLQCITHAKPVCYEAKSGELRRMVVDGKLPINHQIIYQLQDIFNLLPDLSHGNFVDSLYIKTNDQMLVVYIAALVRSIVALHNLINNKLSNRDAEKKETSSTTTKKEEKPKEEEAKKDVKAK